MSTNEAVSGALDSLRAKVAAIGAEVGELRAVGGV